MSMSRDPSDQSDRSLVVNDVRLLIIWFRADVADQAITIEGSFLQFSWVKLQAARL